MRKSFSKIYSTPALNYKLQKGRMFGVRLTSGAARAAGLRCSYSFFPALNFYYCSCSYFKHNLFLLIVTFLIAASLQEASPAPLAVYLPICSQVPIMLLFLLLHLLLLLPFLLLSYTSYSYSPPARSSTLSVTRPPCWPPTLSYQSYRDSPNPWVSRYG